MDSAPEVTGGGEVSAQQAAPQPQAPSKFKIPVDGQEVEVDLDELKRGYSHARAANKRMQEAAAIRKAEEARKQRALKGDLDWLEELGAPEEQILKWAEQKLLKKIEFESMPEAERNYVLEKQKREQLEQQLQELTAKERQQMEAAIQQKAFADVDEEIAKALESFKGKKTPRLVRRVAEAMLANLESNQAPLPSQRALQIAQKSLNEDVQEYLNIAPMSELVKMFSKEQLNQLRQVFVDEAKAYVPASRQTSQNTQNVQRRPSDKMTTDDFFSKLENKFQRRK